MIVVRYADDLVVGFEHEADARRFRDAMRKRFEQFSLELHGQKTRLLEFGRYAIERRQRTGQGKPQTFNFLGFTFICGRSRRGAFLLRRHTRRDRMRAALQEVKTQLRNRRSDSIAEQGRWLRSVVTGYFAYHAVPTNAQAIGADRPASRPRSLAPLVTATQPEGPDDLGAYGSPGHRMATPTPRASSMAGRSPDRLDPR